MAHTRVLVLGCTAATPRTRDQLVRLGEQARRRGVRLVGADTRAGLAAATMRQLSVVDETVAFDVHDPVASRRWARGRTDIDAVVTLREPCVLPVAVIAAELGLAGNAPDVVRGLRAADVCRKRLRSAGFPQPRVAACTSRRDAEEFMREHRGPWVVKDGTGVTVVHDAAGLVTGPGAFLIETFVAGREFTATGVVVGGVPQVLAITAERVETGHVSDPALTVAADTVARAITAAGVTHGAFHIEFWLTPRGVVIGEVHARPGDAQVGPELCGLWLDDLLGATPAPVALAA